MDERILERINKLKALADRGVDGEKESAEQLLSKLMKKYNLTLEELTSESIEKYEFYCHGQFGTRLFQQIVYSVNPELNVLYYTNRRSDCKTRFVECTNSEFLEISELYEFYRHHLDQGMEMYFRAFVQAEYLFPDRTKYPKEHGSSELTEEDLKMLKLAGNLDKHTRYLKLEENNSK